MEDIEQPEVHPETPREHWRDMPEFTQTKQKPFAQIILRVETPEMLAELSRRLEQPLTAKTKSAWFPFKSHFGLEKKVWKSDES